MFVAGLHREAAARMRHEHHGSLLFLRETPCVDRGFGGVVFVVERHDLELDLLAGYFDAGLIDVGGRHLHAFEHFLTVLRRTAT